MKNMPYSWWEHDDRTGHFEKQLEVIPMNQIDTKGILTLAVGLVVAAAFLFVVIAPAFNVIVPSTTFDAVLGLFSALAGGGSAMSLINLGQKQALTAQSMQRLAGYTNLVPGEPLKPLK